jgi:flagellar biosynthesis chaperone FliJ
VNEYASITEKLCTDEELPGLISNRLSHNFDAVHRYDEVLNTLNEVQLDLQNIQDQYKQCYHDNQFLSESLTREKENYNMRITAYESRIQQMENELNSALDLVENQNSLIAANEVKVCDLKM